VTEDEAPIKPIGDKYWTLPGVEVSGDRSHAFAEKPFGLYARYEYEVGTSEVVPKPHVPLLLISLYDGSQIKSLEKS